MAEENGKDLEVRKPGLMQPRDTKSYGIDLGEEDIIIPRLQLVQPTSKMDGAGKFYYPLTDKLLDKFEAVFFSNDRGRVMFNPDISKMESICGSNDRIVPAPRYENPMANRCVECPYSKRQYSTEVLIGGNKKKQECSETQALKGMFVDDLLPFWFIGRKTSLFPVNQFLTAASFDAMKYQKPLYCFPVEVSTKLIDKPGQKYYIPVIKQLSMLEKEEFARMMHKYESANIDDTLKQEETIGTKRADDEEVPF